MPKVIISDTSVLILFQKIGKLELLQKIYQEIITTPEVADEYGEELPDWINIHHVSDKRYQKLLEIQIDKGEASAIALATEFSDVLLLLDDLKARKIATRLNLKFTGALGIIHRSKQLGIIEKVKPLLDEILNTNFHVSEKIILELLELNGESEKEKG
jgi:predicted nucleic acid-binding protein